MKLGFYLTPCIKINSKWVKNLNVKPETKTVRRRHGKNSVTFICSTVSWIRTPKEKAARERWISGIASN
jgi:hypothetical protein